MEHEKQSLNYWFVAHRREEHHCVIASRRLRLVGM
jgi:hypothetical protein